MSLPRSRSAAFSLVEMMVTVAMIGVAGLGVFEILRTGLILFGKNTSINISHSESRFALLTLQQELNSAVSTPELTDSAGNILTSGTATGPAAGVSFQAYAGGPFCLYVSGSSVPSTATSIQVVTGNNFVPVPGEELNIQASPLTTTSTSSLLEVQLSGSAPYAATTSGTAGTYTPTLVNAIGSSIDLKDPVSHNPLHVACFFTAPIVYLVQNGQILRYSLDPAGSGKMLPTVLSSNVTSATPFSMPTINSSPQNTFLEVQNFTAIDPTSSNRGYKSVTTPFSIQIPHLAQLTNKY